MLIRQQLQEKCEHCVLLSTVDEHCTVHPGQKHTKHTIHVLFFVTSPQSFVAPHSCNVGGNLFFFSGVSDGTKCANMFFAVVISLHVYIYTYIYSRNTRLRRDFRLWHHLWAPKVVPKAPLRCPFGKKKIGQNHRIPEPSSTVLVYRYINIYM